MTKKIDYPVLICTLALLVAGLYGLLALEPAKVNSPLGWLLVAITNVGFWASLWQLSRLVRARVPNRFARAGITITCVFAFLLAGVWIGGMRPNPQDEPAAVADESAPLTSEEQASLEEIMPDDGPTYAWDEPTETEDAPEPPVAETACAPLKSFEKFTPPNHVKAPGEDALTSYYRLGRVPYGEILLAVSGEDAWVALDSRGKWMDVEPALLDADICVGGQDITFKGRAVQAKYSLDNDRFRRQPAGE